MSENVTIPFGESGEDTAVLLLAAAEDLGLHARVVTTGSFKNFYAPLEVAEAAGVDYIADSAVDAPTLVGSERPAIPGEPDRSIGVHADEEDVEGETESQSESAYDPGEYNVDEVLDYLAANPEQREAVIAAERAGKNRVTITESE